MKRFLTAFLAIVAIAFGVAAPASSAPPSSTPEIEYSEDSRAWGSSAPALFDESLLVPGRTVSTRLWVRHHGPSGSRLSLTIDDDRSDPDGSLLRRHSTIRINGDPVRPGDTWQSSSIEPGTPVKLTIDVILSADAPNAVRRQSADVISSLTFTASIAPTPDDPGRDGSSGPSYSSPGSEVSDAHPLAHTGPRVVLVLAAGLVALITGLLLRRRSSTG